jgi:hypothetical protein
MLRQTQELDARRQMPTLQRMLLRRCCNLFGHQHSRFRSRRISDWLLAPRFHAKPLLPRAGAANQNLPHSAISMHFPNPILSFVERLASQSARRNGSLPVFWQLSFCFDNVGTSAPSASFSGALLFDSEADAQVMH